MEVRNWPSCFPEGCPPNGCDCNVITVYRFTSENICEYDFVPHKVLYPNRIFTDLINSYGLSVYTSKEELIRLIKAGGSIRRLIKHKPNIAIGDTRDGIHKNTPSDESDDHRTLWLYEGSLPHTYFTKCDMV